MVRNATKEYIIDTVGRTNVLPVNSSCNTSCIFCSHRQNPEGVEVYRMPKLSLEDFEEIVSFLSGDGKIVIGESATRIMEGEPLLHQDFVSIIERVRRRFPKTCIQITTNAILLDESLIGAFEALGGIELNISVNCVDPGKRMKILGTKHCGNIVEILGLLAGRLKFSGSCVIVPGLMDRDDLEELAGLLETSGADSLRVFLPGYTAASGTDFDLRELYEEVQGWVKGFEVKYRLPVVVEPAFIQDTKAVVAGVIVDSPAFLAGVMNRDIIEQINGEKVYSRVDAFNRAYRASNPRLVLRRDGATVVLRLRKAARSSPGFILLYDIDPSLHLSIQKVAARYGAKKILLVTSELASEVFTRFMEENPPEFVYHILTVRNLFFGGSIKCTGLLTVQDIIDQTHRFLETNERPELLILPPNMFDYRGRDITGCSIERIKDSIGIPADIP